MVTLNVRTLTISSITAANTSERSTNAILTSATIRAGRLARWRADHQQHDVNAKLFKRGQNGTKVFKCRTVVLELTARRPHLSVL